MRFFFMKQQPTTLIKAINPKEGHVQGSLDSLHFVCLPPLKVGAPPKAFMYKAIVAALPSDPV